MSSAEKDNWSTDTYRQAAGFVPKLATKVVDWLDVQPDDRILDLGCGDGVLTNQLAQSLTTGHIHGLDASKSMITTSKHTALANNLPATYAVADCSALLTSPTSEATKWETAHRGKYSKVFSNAALHWILKNPDNRVQTFQAAYDALEPGGTLVFEMGGQGNVAELRGTILLSVARMIGIEAARAADPWFFPDEPWMAKTLGDLGFAIEKMEIEARPTAAEEGPGGGLDGWLRLMAKDWLDVLPNETDKEVCVAEVKEALETVCGTASGQPRYILNYKRLRVKARKPE